MLIFIYGQDSFSSQEHLDSLLAKAKAEGSEVHVFRDEDADWEIIAPILYGSGLFSTKKTVVLKNALDNKSVREPLAEYLESHTIGSDVTLVIYQSGTIDKRLGLIKKLLKDAEAKEFASPEPYTVEAWIKKWVEQAGKSIEPAAVRHLMEIVGTDLWRAKSEVEKLTHLPGSVITFMAAKDLAQSNLNDDIWQFVDAVGNGNKKLALQLLEQQFLAGSEPLYLLSMVIREVRLMLALSNSNSSDKELAATLSLHPFVVQKTRARSRAMSALRLKGMYQALVKLDSALKSGKGEPRLLFTILLDSILK